MPLQKGIYQYMLKKYKILTLTHHNINLKELGRYVIPETEGDLLKQKLHKMKEALQTFAAKHAQSRIQTHVGHGHVPETILKTAEDIGADLIVMAAHPPNELTSMLVGSYASKVVRHAPISVMVAR